MIDPHRLETWLLSFAMRDGDPVALRDFFVGSGDWSALLRDVASSPLHHEIVELLAHDLKMRRNARAYRRLVEQSGVRGTDRPELHPARQAGRTSTHIFSTMRI